MKESPLRPTLVLNFKYDIDSLGRNKTSMNSMERRPSRTYFDFGGLTYHTLLRP